MRTFSKISLTLFVFFAVSLLCLAVTLLSLLCRRRRHQQQPLAGDAELGYNEASFNETALFSFLCCTIQSRVEPARDSPVLVSSGGQKAKIPTVAPVESLNEECALDIWPAAAFGPSRVLYTIKEEEREDFEFEEREEDELFTTPCESPEFYTPASSPDRAPEVEVAVAVLVSPAAERGFGRD